MANCTEEAMSSVDDDGEGSAERAMDEQPRDARSKRGVEGGFPSAEWRRSMTRSTGTKRGGVKRTAGSVLVFCGKLAALEVLRRGSQARCRFVWWALQGLSISGAPALGWLRRWTPFRVLADTTESFSKPMLFLSLATVVASAYNEARLSPSVAFLKEDLRKHGVIFPKRVDDEELKRFWFASKEDRVKFVTMMQKSLKWRESYNFMSSLELGVWSRLVFWHLQDAHGRPILIVRLGLACTTMTPAQRPQFARAVISQVEYGLRNLVCRDDPRITVVMDCQGTSVFGFPLQMLKSCVALVQEHYPMRLASFFLVKAPPLVRAAANAIIQILEPAIRKKVRVEGDKYLRVLATSFGGCNKVPAVLGGSCACAVCVAVEEKLTPKISFTDSLVKEPEYGGSGSEQTVRDDVIYIQPPHLRTLRFVILALVCVWIVIVMVNGRS